MLAIKINYERCVKPHNHCTIRYANAESTIGMVKLQIESDDGATCTDKFVLHIHRISMLLK